MSILFFFLIFYNYANIVARKNDSPPPTAPFFFALLESMKTSYNETWEGVKVCNSRLNDHFRTTKDNKIKNAKRSAFLGAIFAHPNICPCILRAPCITQPITKEPLDDIVLQEFSNELDSNLNIYLTQFDPSVFSTAFYLDDNKFVNPKSQ